MYAWLRHRNICTFNRYQEIFCYPHKWTTNLHQKDIGIVLLVGCFFLQRNHLSLRHTRSLPYEKYFSQPILVHCLSEKVSLCQDVTGPGQLCSTGTAVDSPYPETFQERKHQGDGLGTARETSCWVKLVSTERNACVIVFYGHYVAWLEYLGQKSYGRSQRNKIWLESLALVNSLTL